jgi:hypothetical protein
VSEVSEAAGKGSVRCRGGPRAGRPAGPRCGSATFRLKRSIEVLKRGAHHTDMDGLGEWTVVALWCGWEGWVTGAVPEQVGMSWQAGGRGTAAMTWRPEEGRL